MDKVQKGVQIAKASAFNKIVKEMNYNNRADVVDADTLDNINYIIKEALDDIKAVKDKYAI